MMKLILALTFTLVVINLPGCKGQNMTALMMTCKDNVEKWQDEAAKWRRQYIAYIICSCLVWFGGMVSVFCWLRRSRNIDSRKRLGF